MKSPFVPMFVSIFASVTFAVVDCHMFGVSSIEIVAWCGFIAAFVSCKLMTAMFLTRGYGDRGQLTILGMPWYLLAVMILVSLPCLSLWRIVGDSGLHPETVANFRSLVLSVFEALVGSLLFWYGYARRAFFALPAFQRG